MVLVVCNPPCGYVRYIKMETRKHVDGSGSLICVASASVLAFTVHTLLFLCTLALFSVLDLAQWYVFVTGSILRWHLHSLLRTFSHTVLC